MCLDTAISIYLVKILSLGKIKRPHQKILLSLEIIFENIFFSTIQFKNIQSKKKKWGLTDRKHYLVHWSPVKASQKNEKKRKINFPDSGQQWNKEIKISQKRDYKATNPHFHLKIDYQRMSSSCLYKPTIRS